MNNTIRYLTALLLIVLSVPASAQINAWLDRSQIAQGETVRLTLQHDGQTDSQPDLSPLKQDFEIVGRSSGTNIQYINGKMNAQTKISLMLLPKRSGMLHIPALQWDGDTSLFLPLKVTASGAPSQSGNAAAAAAGNNAHVFLTATPEQKQPYVQAAIPLTVRIYTDQPLYQATLDLQASNDVLVQQLGQDKQTRETRNGRSYQVIERKYLLFPQRSGRLQLAGAVLNAQVQDDSNNNDPFGDIFGRNPFAGMLNTTRPIRIQSAPVVLDVRPRPASAKGHTWLPAQQVTLEGSWKPDVGAIQAGDPVTLHLHLKADGLTAAQLPDLSQLLQLPDGLRAYPDQPKLNDDASGGNVIGTRDQDIAIIAKAAGHYEIPALHLGWWDVAQEMPREIVLPAHTLDISPGVGGGTGGTSPSTQNSVSPASPVETSLPQAMNNPAAAYPWQWISLVFASLWLATLAAWWGSRRRNIKTQPNLQQTESSVMAEPNMSAARKAFKLACQANDAAAARRHLLEWAHTVWPQDPPTGLKSLSQRLDDAQLEPLLTQLDRACYAGAAWQGNALLQSLQTLSGKKSEKQAAQKLAGLYQ